MIRHRHGQVHIVQAERLGFLALRLRRDRLIGLARLAQVDDRGDALPCEGCRVILARLRPGHHLVINLDRRFDEISPPAVCSRSWLLLPKTRLNGPKPVELVVIDVNLRPHLAYLFDGIGQRD